ncbi:MAG: epoxyqueuosine reductase QueH [Clostridia bacterium]|nr:epoxyqueuosine reductase QueH [Clostridia bacterium]
MRALKHNYQADTDKIVSRLSGEKPSLLLQCCCGPCSSYVLEYLTQHFNVTVLFYNPNIQPRPEYEKRLFWLEDVVSRYNGEVRVMDCGYDGGDFEEISKGLELEPEGGGRCTKCFELRLRETAKRAAENGFDFFCTTLTVSPHKDSERINETALVLEREYGIKWLPSDFKKRDGYKRSIELSREYGLYRQDYCGCLFSLAQSEVTRKDNLGNEQ